MVVSIRLIGRKREHLTQKVYDGLELLKVYAVQGQCRSHQLVNHINESKAEHLELMSSIPFIRVLSNSLKEVDKINQSNLWLGDEERFKCNLT